MRKEFNIEIFLERIEFLIQERCHGNRSEFNNIVGQRSADYRWRNEKRFPRIEALIKICNHFELSMDWLLGLDDSHFEDKADDITMPEEDYRELLNHYKEVASHYRNLYEHAKNLLEPFPFQKGAEEKVRETLK